MEFETSADEQVNRPDEIRLEASARKLTLMPVHDNVAPEELPDEQIAMHHSFEPVLANTSTDTEQTVSTQADTTTIATPLSKHPAHRTAIYTSASVVTILGILVSFVALTRR